jgi:hypothetical protein
LLCFLFSSQTRISSARRSAHLKLHFHDNGSLWEHIESPREQVDEHAVNKDSAKAALQVWKRHPLYAAGTVSSPYVENSPRGQIPAREDSARV